ncbi:MAG: hypothetical protein ABI824_02020 [Acidobacteriota bacterium]
MKTPDCAELLALGASTAMRVKGPVPMRGITSAEAVSVSSSAPASGRITTPAAVVGTIRSSASLKRRTSVPTSLPVEWMDPMSWRLPSGKGLAEFALQSGFLAPLMLGVSMHPARKSPAKPAQQAAHGVGLESAEIGAVGNGVPAARSFGSNKPVKA